MGCFYFSVPVVAGSYIMQWAISKSHYSIGEHGERLPVKEVQGIGDVRVDEQGNRQRVGAGGWGAGVKLAVSDEETQRRNREQLNKFLKAQKRRNGKKNHTDEHNQDVQTKI